MRVRHNKAVIALLLAVLVPIPALGQDALSQFMEAARDGHKEKVQTFLDAGTEVNAKDTNGFTALEYAAFMGRTETVQALLEAGADVNGKDYYGRTALVCAA